MKTAPGQAADSLSQHLQALTRHSGNASLKTTSNSLPASQHAQHVLLSTPVALRQLLSEHQSIHRLLPQISATSAMWPAPNPVTTLLSTLSASPATLDAPQLRRLINQWFATHPLHMLTSPSLQPTSWLQALAPAILFLLRSTLQSRQGTERPASQKAQGETSPQSALAASMQHLKGALHSIRLSQIHLAETTALHQPEYYLSLPYQEQSDDTWLELLLRRDNPQQSEQGEPCWRFTVRLNLLQHGAILVKGKYQTDQLDIRFYSESSVAREKVEQALDYFRQRLQKYGIENPALSVYEGKVPSSLAPYPSQSGKEPRYER